MAISNIKTQWQIRASAATTANQGTGSVTIGDASIQTRTHTPSTDVSSMRITADAASNVATLTLTSGAVAQTTGSPEVTRWTGQTADLAGEDFEGVTLPTIGSVEALRISIPSTNTGVVTMQPSNNALPEIEFSALAAQQMLLSRSAGLSSPGTLAFTFNNADDYVEIVYVGTS